MLDLTKCKSLNSINTSNTELGIDLGTGSAVNIINLGSPTSITIKNPTNLTPNGVMVDSYGNLSFLDLRNVPNAKTYSVFEKIMDIFIVGGYIIEGEALNSDGTTT